MQSTTPDQLANLLSSQSAWPGGPGPAEHIQTHISHVFLTGERVFKLRKAVSLPFLDFGTREARNADCVHELELNRRLAPSVYLGIAPLVEHEDSVQVGPVQQSLVDPDLEHVVVMRRLSPGNDALSLLERNRLGSSEVEAIAELLGRFHNKQGLGRPSPWGPEEWLERTSAPIFASLTSLAESDVVPRTRIDELTSRIREELAALAPYLEERRIEGRAVDGHGDLHLDHAWFEEGEREPLLIDCLEFNEALRKVDRASEIAFLAMDLRYREQADLAECFLARYARDTDDYGLFSVVDLFSAYRALVRAKVAALAALQQSIAEPQRAQARSSVDRHLSLTESLLEPSPPRGLIVLCGTVGSGKSSVALQLARTGGGIPIASDRVRKALAGVAPTTHSAAAPDEGLYDPKRTEHVYQALLARALPIIESGRTAILDASFATKAQREIVRSWAADRGLPARLIEVRCDSSEALNRLRERERVGIDPSDAGPDFLSISEARFEPPLEWPEADRRVIWTNREDWKRQIG
jgi:aminoglycoside phosphotransferase family enzyme/predicted kinase